MVYLFDRYELDEVDLGLARDGRRLALEPKALRVLLLMVQSRGKLLKKETILEAVWAGTVVEENSLSRAVALLRKLLGDDARRPRFIETVPTLGYRFLPPVSCRENPDPALLAADEAPRRPSRIVLLWTIGGMLLLGTAIAIFWGRSRIASTDRKSIVLAEFSNSTGDAVFDDTLRQGLIVQLEQSPVLSILSEQRIQRLLTMMDRPSGVRVSSPLGRELCERAGSAALLSGSIALLGNQYVLGLQAIDCVSGEIIDSEQMQVDRKEDVLHALSAIATKLRTKLGESIASVASLDTPLMEATTGSLEALKAFSEANRILSANGSAAALPFFDRAVELDPRFALAYAMRGRAYGDTGQELESAKSTAAAYQYRNRASETERLFITASYDLQVTGNLERAKETCDAWRRLYPLSAGPYGFPAGVILRVFGQYDAGAEYGRGMLERAGDFSIPYHLLISNLIALGQWSDADSVLQKATTRNLQIPFFYLDRYRLAFLRGDDAGMQSVATRAATQPGAQDMLANQEAAVLAYHGQLHEARELSQRAVALASNSGRREVGARLQAAAAIREALFGHATLAISEANAALELSRGRDVQYGSALALAWSGASIPATALADDLDARLPEDTSVRYHYLPAIRAVLAMNRGDPTAAIQILRVNARYEMGSPQSSFRGYYGALYPLYIRGLAYRELHQPASAAAEFQKILDHPGIVVTDPIGALSLLQAARAYRAAGDDPKADAAYGMLEKLWPQADQNESLPQQARQETRVIDTTYPHW